ncbi:MAG: hypothetical protein Tsb0013_09570 [Phycisphaerales bacterium]
MLRSRGSIMEIGAPLETWSNVLVPFDTITPIGREPRDDSLVITRPRLRAGGLEHLPARNRADKQWADGVRAAVGTRRRSSREP